MSVPSLIAMHHLNPIRWHITTWFILGCWLLFSVWSNVPHQVGIEELEATAYVQSSITPDIIDAEHSAKGATVTARMPTAAYTFTIQMGWPRAYISHTYSPPSTSVATNVDYFAASQNCVFVFLVLASIVVVGQGITRISTQQLFAGTSAVALTITLLLWLIKVGSLMITHYIVLAIYFSPLAVFAIFAIRKILSMRQSKALDAEPRTRRL